MPSMRVVLRGGMFHTLRAVAQNRILVDGFLSPSGHGLSKIQDR